MVTQADLDSIKNQGVSTQFSHPLPPDGDLIENWERIYDYSCVFEGEPVLIEDPDGYYRPSVGYMGYDIWGDQAAIEYDDTSWDESEIADGDIRIYRLRIPDDPACRDAKPSIGDLI